MILYDFTFLYYRYFEEYLYIDSNMRSRVKERRILRTVLLKTRRHHFPAQLVDVGEDGTFTLGRRLLETIDVVA